MTISKEHEIQREDDEPPGITERRLAALEDKISHPRWVVPVLPEQELEILLVAATKMAITGEDIKNPLCQRFYSDSLGVSFTKVLTDEAVSTWKTNIQLCVRSNCERLVRLCALKMDDARFLHLLAMLFNPSNKFHSFNANRHSEPPLVIDMDLDEPLPNQIAIEEQPVTDKQAASPENSGTGDVEPAPPPVPEVYARCPDQRSPKGWLVDIINVFGTHHGFERLRERLDLVIAGQLPPPPPSACASPQPGTSGAGDGDRLSAKSPVGDRQGHTLEQATSLERPTPSPTDQLSQLASLDPPSGEADEMAASTSSCCSRRQTRQNGTPTPSDSAVMAAWQLLRPFGLCHELLSPDTIVRYIQPLIEHVPTLLDRLTDEELKREARGSENKTDTVSCLIRACKSLAQRIPNHQELARGLEMFRLKMILRLLQMSSFNGRMSALNEINQLIGSVTQQPRPEWLTSAVIATWIRENDVLEIVLRESLHQPQYVERLEKMLRFMIKEGALRLSDLDAIWRAQLGKHEAIVKNLHDLLAKLAWDFTPDQLDHLFDCFKASWSTSSKKQSDKLLEVIRRLAEDDKDGVMAHKVLVLFWNLAHAPDICNEVMDVALSNHVKILDYSCSNDRDAQKAYWLNKCVEEMKTSENWVLPALKQIREICCLYEISANMAGGHVPAGNLPDALPANTRPSGTGHAPLYRQEVIDKLQDTHSLVIQVTDSLTNYMERARNVAKQTPNLDFDTWLPDGRYPHSAQVHERLSFLRFLLKDGQLWLCAEQIWVCLAEQGVVSGDREACFRWFSKLMGEEPDLDPGISLHFFRQNIMTLEPRLLTFSGIKCFERFFKAVNCKEGKLIIQRRNFFIDDADLIGLDYLWRVITECNDEISARGVELLREVCTNVGPRLSASMHHENFLTGCCSRLERLQRNLGAAEGDEEINAVCIRMFRVLRAVQEYVNECDRRFTADRHILPMYRAGRGRHCSLVVRFQAGQRPLDDMELYSHSNETLQGLKNTIQSRLKCGTGGRVKLDLYANGEVLDSSHDRKLLAQIPIRDKMVLVGKVGGTVGHLSNDSSSDSSTGSPPPPMFAETSLPGVILSRGQWYIPFILELEHQGTVKNHSQLRDAAHMLTQSVPSHFSTVDKLLAALVSDDENILKQQLYGPSPCTVAYNVAVLYSMVMPALEPLGDRSRVVQLACVRRVPMLIEALNDEAFLKGAAHHTWRLGYLYLMKLVKVVLTAWGHMFDMLLTEQRTPLQNSSSPRPTTADVLREALLAMPSQSSERMVKAVSEKLAQDMAEQVNDDASQVALATLLSWQIPARTTVRMVCSIATKAATYHTLVGLMLHPDDVTLVRECVEVVTLAVALGGGQLDKLLLDKEPWWQETVFELTVMSPNVLVRVSCAEQILAMCSWGRVSPPLQSGNCPGRAGGRGAAAAWCLAMFLPQADSALVKQYCHNAQQFMQLLCRLVSLAGGCGEDKLNTEVQWLRNCLAASREGKEYDDTLLEGHLIIAKEMFLNTTPEVKFKYGSCPNSPEGGLVKELVCSFLWPSSWAQWELRGGGGGGSAEPRARALSRPPVCRTAGAAAAACDLLAALSHACHANMETLAVLLTNMFYDDSSSALMEWDYLPSVGPRSACGQVGLKNAGATCYMNSVLQQIYMVPAIREYLLTVQGAVTDPNEDFSGEDPLPHLLIDNNIETSGDYNVCILKQVQAIFTHLRYSKLQYYVPRGLWTHFKLQGEPVNVREQQDAVEFFMSLVETLDEALKTLGQEQYMAKVLGGSFADQKICKGCPHRYCKEEPFSVVSLDIRNMSRLQESLEAYVRGELLEGADAYHCDKCNKKVVTVKRLCLNKLPPVLGIQLKRFEYDFDKVCAIKFNDYFEFPRELDVEPYTVRGLAKAEGEAALLEECGETGEPPETHYQLTGIVVHSGQASGGHYYSYILTRDTNGVGRWMKFDDGDVTECAMHDDEEMKAQCFGGEYMGERVSYRRQKRWWNAYMLFYTRRDQVHRDAELYQDFASLSLKESKVPRPIWECVQRGNIAFSHHQDQFSHEHFNFMKKLCCMRMQAAASGQSTIWGTDQEELSILSIQLATKFLFHVGFKTKKSLRGPISDWYDIFCQHLRSSRTCRAWFALNAIFQNPARLGEYLFVCPSPDVRLVVTKLIVFLAHFSYNDAPVSWTCGWTWDTAPRSLAEQVMGTVLALAARPVEYGFQRSQLPPIFTLLHMYATRGVNERRLLAKLHAIQVLITVAVDDNVSSMVKHQYPEGVKIHQVIAAIVRSCDVLSRCQSSNSNAGVAPLPNPLSDPPPSAMSPGAEPRPELPVKCAEVLYNKNGYVKRLVEDCNSEEEIRMVQFLAWENPAWSRAVLAELLWQMAYAYCHELRRHADTLLGLLLLEDSWQAHRIHNAIKGVTDEREGLMETAVRSRGHYAKRAYACVRLLVGVMLRCPAAVRAVNDQPEERRRWRATLAWLQDELDREEHSRRFGSGGYTYNTWSPPNNSSDNSSGYFLERSNSARKTIERAYELCPEEEEEDDEDESSECGDVMYQSTPMGPALPGAEQAAAEGAETSQRQSGRASPVHSGPETAVCYETLKQKLGECSTTPEQEPGPEVIVKEENID